MGKRRTPVSAKRGEVWHSDKESGYGRLCEICGTGPRRAFGSSTDGLKASRAVVYGHVDVL